MNQTADMALHSCTLVESVNDHICALQEGEELEQVNDIAELRSAPTNSASLLSQGLPYFLRNVLFTADHLLQ